MVDIPTIEPFQFIRSTAFSERVQLANKLNEVIDAVNQIGTVDDLQTQIDAINSEISEIQTAIEDTNSDVSTLSNQVNTLVSEVNGLLKEVVNEVVLDAPEYGQVRVKVIHEDETETASNALQIPVIVDGGISLISGTTARSFKIRYITADGVTHTTNDFVIPEGGGGTDVTVSSVTILEGDTENSFKFEIGLSDGSEFESNSYPFPASSELTPATASQLGGIKVGTHLSVTADGTLSVDMTQINTAAVASTVMFTADASKVTMHADSLAGSEFTKDIPRASQGRAGTIDQASYAKIAATEAKVNALAPSVSVNEETDPPTITVNVNGKSSTANLPAGGDGWEELDISNLPTDFKANDIIFGFTGIHPNVKAPSWTSPASITDYTQDDVYRPFIFMLTDLKQFVRTKIAEFYNTVSITAISSLSLNYVNTPSVWNEGGSPTEGLFQFAINAFNGSGCSAVYAPTINKDNITQFVHKMWRLKSE